MILEVLATLLVMLLLWLPMIIMFLGNILITWASWGPRMLLLFVILRHTVISRFLVMAALATPSAACELLLATARLALTFS